MSRIRKLAWCALFLVICLLHLDLSTATVFTLGGENRVRLGSGSAFVGWEGATYNPKRTWGRNPIDETKVLPQDWREPVSDSTPTDVHKWYVEN